MKNPFTMLTYGTLTAASLMLLVAGGASAQTARSVTPVDAARNGSPSAIAPAPITPCGRVNMLTTARISDTEATLCWNPAAVADSFRVVCTQISNGAATSRIVSASNHFVTFTGLLPVEQYKWYVIGYCNGLGMVSGSSKFITNSTQRLSAYVRNNTSALQMVCPGPGTVTVPDVNYDKAIIDWTSHAAFDSIQFRFNVTGSLITKTVSITGNPSNTRYVLNGLSELTSYDVTVATWCSGAQSAWTSPISFITLRAPGPRLLDPEAGFSIKLSPNPAYNNTYLTVYSNGNGTCQVRIYDITGKEKMAADTELTETAQQVALDLTTLPRGIYLVKVKNNNHSTAQRLIIN